MNWLNYRDILGFVASNSDCDSHFIAQIHNFFDSASDIEFTRDNEREFCNEIGKKILPEDDFIKSAINEEPINLQRAWSYMENYTDFENVLFSIVALFNTYKGKNSYKQLIKNTLIKALDDSNIPYEILIAENKFYILPRGAKELDIKLVSEPLEWINDYPETQKLYALALNEYTNCGAPINIADNLRKTLETFLHEFFNNKRNLDNNIHLVGDYLKNKDADTDLTKLFTTLLSHYNQSNNTIAKHDNKVTQDLLEFLIYQTGIFIRTLIVLKTTENIE